MAQSWCTSSPWITKSFSAKSLEPTEPPSFLALWCFQKLQSTHLNGLEDSFLWSQHSRWRSTNRKVEFDGSHSFGILILHFFQVRLWRKLGYGFEPITHGQLYVACSRVGKPERLKFALKQESSKKQRYLVKATNIVFKEVLLNSWVQYLRHIV